MSPLLHRVALLVEHDEIDSKAGVVNVAGDAACTTVPVTCPPPISVPPRYSMIGARYPVRLISHSASRRFEGSPVELNTWTCGQPPLADSIVRAPRPHQRRHDPQHADPTVADEASERFTGGDAFEQRHRGVIEKRREDQPTVPSSNRRLSAKARHPHRGYPDETGRPWHT